MTCNVLWDHLLCQHSKSLS